MQITKLGHCCLLIERKNLRILTDPGNYSETQNTITNIDLVIISHEHQDHLHIDSLKTILGNNPNAKIITNSSVGALLEKENIHYELVDDGKSFNFKGLAIEGFGKDHEPIYNEVGLVENTAYLIDNFLFYPGDSFYNPNRQINTLALPVAGPWMKLSDAVNYALELKPKNAFPVHDGMLKILGPSHRIPKMIFEQNGINFIEMSEGDMKEFI